MRPMFVADGWRDNKPSCIPATWHLCVEKKEGRGSQRQCGQRRGTRGRNLLVTGNWHSYWLKHHYIKMIICTGCKLEPLLDPWIQKSIWHPFDGAGIYYYIFINIIYIYQHIPTNPTIVSHIFTSPAPPTGGFQGRLGEGGLATVFRAWDCKGNLGKVAVTWIWWVECFFVKCCVVFVLLSLYWFIVCFKQMNILYNGVFLFSQ